MRGRVLAAAAAYDKAIDLAKRHGFVQDEALACELAARFHDDLQKPRIAAAYRADAIRGWRHWGAHAKVHQLQHRFEALTPVRDQDATPNTSTRRTTSNAAGLDSGTVIKAAQAISSEIVLADLVEKLLAIVLESAGAGSGVLILERGGTFMLEAEAPRESRRDASALEAATGVSLAIIKYVLRTGDTVVLGNAAQDGAYVHDSHVQTTGARSVLCAPLTHRGQLIGALYLENRLTSDAFTPDRVELLRVLSAQAAISLTNARLVDELQTALARQTALVEAQLRFVPREFLQKLGRTSIVEVELGDSVEREMTVLLSDIVGFTAILERMRPAESIEFLNNYLGYMEPAIVEHGGFVDSYIGDAIVALFDRTEDAVAGAVAMLQALQRHNADSRARPEGPLRMGIGLNTGRIILGTIGGKKSLKCGVLGDTVNLAARIESLTRRYDAPLLVSQHVVARLSASSREFLRPVDRVQVVGKSEIVTLHEVFAADPPPLRAAKQAIQGPFHRAVDLFYAGEFTAARELLTTCVAALPGDKVVRAYLERCDELTTMNPDPDWTGVVRLDHK